MVKVSVLYPNRAGTKFDMTYYLNHHIPMVRRLLGSALKGVSVEHGISGEEPGLSAPFRSERSDCELGPPKSPTFACHISHNCRGSGFQQRKEPSKAAMSTITTYRKTGRLFVLRVIEFLIYRRCDGVRLRQPDYCNFAYSALASFRMGMSGSAFFQSVRKS